MTHLESIIFLIFLIIILYKLFSFIIRNKYRKYFYRIITKESEDGSFVYLVEAREKYIALSFITYWLTLTYHNFDSLVDAKSFINEKKEELRRKKKTKVI